MKKRMLLCLPACLLCIAFYAFFPRPYTYDAEKAQAFLNDTSHSRSQGLCAMYVRLALEAGGCCTWGHPSCAKDYKEFLTYLEFSPVAAKDYRRQKGDIVVFNATKGHRYGHIAMWNGKQWISDFKQKGFYVAHAYRTANDYQIFRMTKAHPKRHFTLVHHLQGLTINPITSIFNKQFLRLV